MRVGCREGEGEGREKNKEKTKPEGYDLPKALGASMNFAREVSPLWVPRMVEGDRS